MHWGRQRASETMKERKKWQKIFTVVQKSIKKLMCTFNSYEVKTEKNTNTYTYTYTNTILHLQLHMH